MEPQKDLKSLIGDALELRNTNLERLSQLTGIPERYLAALQNLEVGKLPAAPYIRGYLKKIAGALHLNYEELWLLYKKETAPQTSGAQDKLPINRFALHAWNKKLVIASIVILLILLYILINAKTIFGTPPLEIMSPSASIIAVTEPTINLEGRIDPKDKLTINGEETLGDQNGEFQNFFNLQPGLNAIEFKVKRLLGKETTVIKQVLYQPKAEEIKN